MAYRKLDFGFGESSQPVEVMHFESEVQRRAYLLLKEVANVRSTTLRPTYKVRFVDKNGEVAYQTFDVHSEFTDGKSVATAVTPLSKYAIGKLLTRLETTGQLVREDGSLGRLSEAFSWMTFVTEEWVNRSYVEPRRLANMVASAFEA